MRPLHIVLSAFASLGLLVACANATPTAAPPKPVAPATAVFATTAPATAVPVSTVPAAIPTTSSAATANPTSSSASPAAVATKPAASTPVATTAPAAVAADARTFKLVADQSEASYTVQETFANLPGLADAVGTTKSVSGQIVITKDLKIADGSKITIDLTTLKSDRSQRDGFIQRTTLKNAPTAVFVPSELRGLPSPAPTSGPIKGQLLGNLTIGAVTKPITFDFDGTIEGNTIKGKATSAIKITDLGLELPKAPIILSVEDFAKLQISFTAVA